MSKLTNTNIVCINNMAINNYNYINNEARVCRPGKPT